MLGLENQQEEPGIRTVGKESICKYWKGKGVRSKLLRKISLVAISKTVWGKETRLGKASTNMR